MTQLSTTPSLPFKYNVTGFHREDNSSGSPIDVEEVFSELSMTLIFIGMILSLIISTLGLVGNGIVIWLLSFHIQKNPITTYILNLAAADFGVLISMVSIILCTFFWHTDAFFTWVLALSICFISAYTCSQYLLTAISIERCLSVIFPIWYRCHRPNFLSVIICTLIWTMSALLGGTFILTMYVDMFSRIPQIINFINFIVCTPIVISCTVILFIRVCCSLHRRRRGKFYVVLLFALLFYLIFGVPLSAIISLVSIEATISIYVAISSLICAFVNSSINPLIYFLIGRKKVCRSRTPLKVALQRVCDDKTDCRDNEKPLSHSNQKMIALLNLTS
ncbi:mas-related G-protein coupled receptor member H-like [Elgaria multicarinata webbii]|uniref:mas-related G-protein coupled receptor member H-like n=1 Tax=Elgaria multicarinata webbii TaxID=159646 RepID=UPI002FCCC328